MNTEYGDRPYVKIKIHDMLSIIINMKRPAFFTLMSACRLSYAAFSPQLVQARMNRPHADIRVKNAERPILLMY